ncbi:hypothetical protein ACFL3T_03250 [Patescibacteria group bacterium]
MQLHLSHMQPERPKNNDEPLLLSLLPSEPLTVIPSGTGTIKLVRIIEETPELGYKKIEKVWLRDLEIIRSCDTRGNHSTLGLNEPVNRFNQASLLALLQHRQEEGDRLDFYYDSNLPEPELPGLTAVRNAIEVLC